MITIHPTVFNILFDINTPWIVIMINLINKAFIFNKNIYLGIIHEYIDTKTFTIIITTSTIIFELFITI